MHNMTDSDISIIIPAHNEAETVGDIIQRIRQVNSNWEILVVDDGSEDRTAEVSIAAGAQVLKHPYNIGMGGAIKNAVRRVKGVIFVLVDGDGQHPPEEIPKLLEKLRDHDMVVGIREMGKQLSYRAFGNRVFNWVGNKLSGHEIPDLTSGFRAIRKDSFMEFIHLLPNGYSSATTLTLAMFKAGLFVSFVPIDAMTIRKKGKSGIEPVSDGFKIVGLIIRIIMVFNPNKFFLPVGGGLLGFGLVFGLFQMVYVGGIRGTTIIFVLTGILILMFGLLADQISNVRFSLQKQSIDRKED